MMMNYTYYVTEYTDYAAEQAYTAVYLINQTPFWQNTALWAALLGGALSLAGSTWITGKQRKKEQHAKMTEKVYRPLYDRLERIEEGVFPKDTISSISSLTNPPISKSHWLLSDKKLKCTMDDLFLLANEYKKNILDDSKHQKLSKLINESFPDNVTITIHKETLHYLLQMHCKPTLSRTFQIRNNSTDDTSVSPDDVINKLYLLLNESICFSAEREFYKKCLFTLNETIALLEKLIKKNK